jgi:2-deoxy-D-gluconate 3-dehydrogenase
VAHGVDRGSGRLDAANKDNTVSGLDERFGLHGQTALVTGARGGIGRAATLALADAGADVVLWGHRPGSLDDVAKEVHDRGRRAVSVTADLADADTVRTAAETVLADHRIDILVNNAGTIRRGPAAETPPEDWQVVLDVNLTALFRLCQLVGRPMLDRGRGKIINVASMLSFQGGVRVPAYTASKHAVAGVTKALANEWAPSGVNVNAIAPGYIATDNTAVLRADPVREPEIRSRIPVGRWGEPDDLAGAVIFLASPASDYVHGHVLAVDGGWLAR